MTDDGQAILVVRGLGAATVSVGALSLAPEADVLFMLALVLAQRAGERISRSELRALIWPAATEESARHTLRQALYRLHKAGLVTEDRTEDVYVDPARVDSDLTRILASDWPEHAEPRDIEAAATILPGVAPREQGVLFEFVESLRARAAAQYRRAVLRRIAAVKREGRWREVEHWALMCLQADPLNEEATLSRAEAAAMVGAKYEAMDILDAYLAELGDRAKVIGLPARMLKKRVSELTDTSKRRIQATSVPFVGRHDLLATVQDTLATSRRGESTALWLIGPPGIGKSRLLREIERVARMGTGTAILAGARPSYAERPFALLTELLPALLDAPGALGAAPPALTLMRQMGRADTNAEPLSPEEARSRQHAIYLCWVELMDAVLAETSLTLIVDDAHWSDQLTLLMLSRFLESRPKARLGIVLAGRRLPSRDDAPAAHILGATQLRIGPLSDDDVRTFTFAAGLGSDVAYETISRRLGRTSGGNPLFLSHLIHQHQMQHGEAELPSDLASLIDTQLRTLSREAMRLLQACSLLGRHSTLPRIERVLGASAPALVPSFSELDEMLVLPTDIDAPLAPHDLWTERVRVGMSAGVFRALAVSVARVLEADAAQDGSIELHWDAARLFRESGEKQLAYATMMRCAEYLSRTGAISDAARAYEQASLHASKTREAVDALFGRIRALRAMSEFSEALRALAELQDLQSQAGSFAPSVDMRVLALEAQTFSSASDSVLADLEPIARDPSNPTALRLHAIFLGMSAADNLHDAHALTRFQRVTETIPTEAVDKVARLRLALVAESSIGDLSIAMATARSFLQLARKQMPVAELSFALLQASYPFRRAGDRDTALSLLLESRHLAEKNNLAYARFRATDVRAGLELEYECLDLAERALVDAETYFTPALGSFFRESLDISWTFWACETANWKAARARALGFPPIQFGSRSRHVILGAAAQMRVAMHDGEDEHARRLLSYILRHCETMLAHSAVDQVACAAYLALTTYGKPTEASAFAERFVKTQRRDRSPIPSLLRLLRD